MRLLIVFGFVLIRLAGCTLVAGDRILGEDMAAEHAAFESLDPKADFGPAPVAGSRRTFQYFEVNRIAKEHSVGLGEDVRREACFERTTVHLDTEDLRTELRGLLNAPDLEILDLTKTALPAGRAEFRKEGLSSTGLWRGKWLYGNNRSIPIWARVSSPSGMFGLRASSEQKIGRGENVRVEVRSGGVLLAFDASTESSAHIGEQVTVLNPANGQRFRAVVQGPGKVEIRK
jgi:hypothetical protein